MFCNTEFEHTHTHTHKYVPQMYADGANEPGIAQVAESSRLATELHVERRAGSLPDAVLEGAGPDVRLTELSERFERFSEVVESTFADVQCCVQRYQVRELSLEQGLGDVQAELQAVMETISGLD